MIRFIDLTGLSPRRDDAPCCAFLITEGDIFVDSGLGHVFDDMDEVRAIPDLGERCAGLVPGGFFESRAASAEAPPVIFEASDGSIVANIVKADWKRTLVRGLTDAEAKRRVAALNLAVAGLPDKAVTYTLDFIEQTIAGIFKRPRTWGDDAAIWVLVLLLVEIRRGLTDPDGSAGDHRSIHDSMGAFADRTLGDESSLCLFDRLKNAGRAAELPALLAQWAEEMRTAPPVEHPEESVDRRVAELTADNERLRALMAGDIPKFRSIVAGPGGGLAVEFTPHWMLKLCADTLGDVLGDAVNYVEVQGEHSVHGDITFTIARRAGQTPHQKRVEAEQRAAALQAKLDAALAFSDPTALLPLMAAILPAKLETYMSSRGWAHLPSLRLVNTREWRLGGRDVYVTVPLRLDFCDYASCVHHAIGAIATAEGRSPLAVYLDVVTP